MNDFNVVARDIAEDAVQFAMQSGLELDYTRESVKNVDAFLEAFYNNLDKYDSDEGAKTLWNAAVLFGVYTGELLLRCGLAQKGYVWLEDDGLPILGIPDSQTTVSPITKAHKRIYNGVEDSMQSFVDVVFSIADGEWPKKGVLRVPDVEMASGEKVEKVVFNETDYYISLVAEGKEDFVIFHSHDGFFQFYGIGDQFVCEVWFNLGERRGYGLVNPDCEDATRVDLVTPFGQYTPEKRDILSLEQLKAALHAYYSNLEEADFLAGVSHEKLELS